MREKGAAVPIPQRRAKADQGGGVVPPDGEHQLSADDRALDAADAGDDHSLLSRLVPDVVYRRAALPGEHVQHFELLPGLAKRALSGELVAHFPILAGSDGTWHWAYRDEHESRPGSDCWQTDG